MRLWLRIRGRLRLWLWPLQLLLWRLRWLFLWSPLLRTVLICRLLSPMGRIRLPGLGWVRLPGLGRAWLRGLGRVRARQGLAPLKLPACGRARSSAPRARGRDHQRGDVHMLAPRAHGADWITGFVGTRST